MTPYKIVDGPWVDLDTIQMIEEPCFEDRMGYGGYFIILRWQHAFQNDANEKWYTQPGNYGTGRLNDLLPSPVMTKEGEPTELVRVREEVFKPFLEAWINR